MRTKGRVTYDAARKRWLIECDAYVMGRVKRIFDGIPKAANAVAPLADTPANADELRWVLDKFPLAMSPEDRARLDCRADAHVARQTVVELCLAEGYVARAFALAVPARAYQRFSADLAIRQGFLLVCDDMGLGKTFTGMCILSAPEQRPAIVVGTRAIIRQWAAKIALCLPDAVVYIAKTTTPFDMTQGLRGKKVPPPDVVLVTYDRLVGWAKTLVEIGFKTIIYDECVTADTMVESWPPGNAKRIVDLRPGDAIAAFDEHANIVEDRVVEIMPKGLREVWRFTLSDGRFIDCTENERILTDAGWVYAVEIIDVFRAHQEQADSPGRDSASGRSGIHVGRRAPGFEAHQSAVQDEPRSETARVRGAQGCAPVGLHLDSSEADPVPRVREDIVRGRDADDPRLRIFASALLQGAHPGQSDFHGVQGRVPYTSEENVCNLRMVPRDRSLQCDLVQETGVSNSVEAVGSPKSAWTQVLRPVAVVRAERIGKLDVWDVEVEKHHTLIANGFAVHNCQAFRHRFNAKKEYTNRYATGLFLRDYIPLKVGMSGTPIYNYGGEIWNVVNILDPDALGTHDEFCRDWCGGSTGKNIKVKDPKALGIFLRERGIMIRHTKEDVGQELPPSSTIVHEIEYDAKKFLDHSSGMLELAKRVIQKGGLGIDKMADGRELDARARHATGVAKAQAVADFVRILVEQGEKEKVVLFGWHKSVYAIWKKALADLGIVFFTGAESDNQRCASMAAFANDPKCQVIALSLRTIEGLDGLQHASSTVVFGELDASPKVMSQDIARVLRDGQKKKVQTFVLVVNEGSDPPYLDILGLKLEQSDGIMDPTKDVVEEQLQDDRITKMAEMILEKHAPGVLAKIRAANEQRDADKLSEKEVARAAREKAREEARIARGKPAKPKSVATGARVPALGLAAPATAAPVPLALEEVPPVPLPAPPRPASPWVEFLQR